MGGARYEPSTAPRHRRSWALLALRVIVDGGLAGVLGGHLVSRLVVLGEHSHGDAYHRSVDGWVMMLKRLSNVVEFHEDPDQEDDDGRQSDADTVLESVQLHEKLHDALATLTYTLRKATAIIICKNSKYLIFS